MTASSVRKKMKQKSFAAAVKREDIERGAQLMGLPLDEHIQGVIGAMQGIAKELGFAPAESRIPERHEARTGKVPAGMLKAQNGDPLKRVTWGPRRRSPPG